MKICRVVSSFNHIGETKGDLIPLFYHQCKYLSDKGYDIHVVCGGESGYENIDGIHVHRVGKINNRRDYLYGDFAKKTTAKIKELNPDIIHGDTSIHFGILSKKHKLNIPIVTHFHTPLDTYKYIDYLPLSADIREALNYRFMIWTYFHENKYAISKSDYIIGVSDYVVNSIKKYYPYKNVQRIYNGVEHDHYKFTESDIKNTLESDNLITFAGRPIPWKGLQYLIPAIKLLNDRFDGIQLLLLSTLRPDMTIYINWLMKIVNSYKLSNVLFYPSVEYSELPKYYSATDCFVLPSYPEGFGLVNIEAQACGCPVVGTNGGGTPELMSDRSGLLFKPKSVEDLAEKIGRVLENKHRYNGSLFVRRNFTWKRCIDEMCDYYDDILSGGS